jgi:CDP-6-deoxy-D-xylo-4-hexulose-3-dehydrase
MKSKHPLMKNNFTRSDMSAVKKVISVKNLVLTQSKNVRQFENKWSRWLGVKYSTFVNSGASANFITLAILKHSNKNKNKNQIIVPSLTWISDVASVIMNGFKPVFVDANLENLSMNVDQVIKKVSKKTLAVFITHTLGFNGLNEKLIKTLKRKKIHLIEDVCESHGATFKNKKLGTFGLISNFSFYYAHHMTTIEGGMICTNDKKIYEMSRILRSHGMLRESGNKSYEKKVIKKNKTLSPQFTFLYPALNFRNTEIGAAIGLNQLKNLTKNNSNRSNNFKYFINLLDGNKYWKAFDLKGNSNYAFPIILKTKNISKRNLFERTLEKNGIEFRRGTAGGGNQLRQPYLKEFAKNINFKKFKNVDHIHFFGYYIGNFPTLKKSKIKEIAIILNKIKI